MWTAILQLLALIAPYIVKALPFAKPVEEKIHDKLVEYQKAREKFEREKDTSDLGRF